MSYKTFVTTKKDTQKMVKALRDVGLTVDKLDSGYECSKDGISIFRAIQGTRGYLIKAVSDLFE